MRPFPLPASTGSTKRSRKSRFGAALTVCLLPAFSAGVAGCAAVGSSAHGGSSGPGTTPQPPSTPVAITVTIAPSSAAVLLGNSQSFTATVTNSDDTTVTWSVNGIPGGNATVGVITPAGIYTAPPDLPSNASMRVTATSHADFTKSANSTVAITSDVQIALSASSAAVELGATRNFHASIASSGHPDAAVRWTLSGSACPSLCGSIDASGTFIAPQILPNPAAFTLTAQSLADTSKQATATLTITSNFTLQLSAPPNVPVSGSATIAAMLSPVTGSNPSPALTWSLSGSGCSGVGCGVLTVLTQQSTGGGAMANSATYNAPSSLPNPATVTITATPQADPSKKAQAALTILPGGSVIVLPSTATLAANHRLTLAAQVGATSTSGGGSGSATPAVNWSVNGIAGGNAIIGQICVAATNPCLPVTDGSAAQVDYLAPGGIPTPNPVTVQATNAADSTKHAAAQITILNHVLVTVQPASATLAPLAVQPFSATVIGTTNQSVVWQLQGSACAGGAAVCGLVSPNGAYTAPETAPTPNAIQVVAISSDDTSQSGAANITITAGANILSLHPASVYAGAANGFVLRVDGSGFDASSPGPGSSLLIGGTSRATTCNSAGECIAPVTPADVTTAGSVSVQVQNSNGAKSNIVSLIVAPPNNSDEVISLTNAAPSATARDIVVVEPTTAGVSVPGNDVDLNLAALGDFSTANNSCSLTGNPVTVQRPGTGTSTADLCLFSESGLDTSMTFSISGPGDIAVISKQPLGLGILRLTLQISAGAAAGTRTVFVQNTNLDKAAASGSLVVN